MKNEDVKVQLSLLLNNRSETPQNTATTFDWGSKQITINTIRQLERISDTKGWDGGAVAHWSALVRNN